jgi:hypothetical protein
MASRDITSKTVVPKPARVLLNAFTISPVEGRVCSARRHRDSVVVRAEMARVYRMLAELRTGLPPEIANSAL